MRLRFGDAVIVLDLVGHLQRAAGLALRILGQRNGRGAVGRSALNFHCGWPEGARTCAVPSPEMVKCRSLVPLGACSVGSASVTPPPAHDVERAAARAHDQRAAGRDRQGSRGGQRGLLVRRRQDDRRLAGIERRRHPGIDPDIGRRQHAVPVERRRGAQAALVAGGDKGRDHHHRDQRAQRPGIVDRQPRRRQAGADALDRGQRALALRLPQRQRHRILRRQRIGQRGRRAMADAGAAVEPAQGLFAASASETGPAGTARASASSREQAEADGARDERQRQPQSGPGHHQKQPDDGQEPRQMRPAPLPGDGVFGPLQGLRQLQPRNGIRVARLALTGRGWRRSTNSPGCRHSTPSTTAAVRHPYSNGNPHPEIRITRRRDWAAATP